MRFAPVILIAALAGAGCDIVHGLGAKETAEWHKTYPVTASTSVDVTDTNGRIDVTATTGSSLEVDAVKTAHAATPEAAKAALERISIAEDVTPQAIKLETKVTGTGGFFNGGNGQVDYVVRVPAGTTVHFSTSNGSVQIDGLQGRVVAETTNGTVRGTNIGGTIDASTTNGGVDVEVTKVAEGGVKLSCTNGRVRLALPRDAKATISASLSNGGISSDNVTIDTTESSRRRLEGRMNGGGPRVQLETTNGGITISGR
jgi:DUF4097 and DUF4098 domain-containing protein YvlB